MEEAFKVNGHSGETPEDGLHTPGGSLTLAMMAQDNGGGGDALPRQAMIATESEHEASHFSIVLVLFFKRRDM